MRSFLLFALPALALAAPPKSPRVTSMTFSGNGCTQGSGSVTSSDVYLDDNFAATFSDLTGDSTSQCQLHVIAQGGSPGWQVAVREVTYSGNVYMRGDSEIQTLTTVYWSENAAKTGTLTGSVVCQGPSLRDYVSITSRTENLVWSQCTGDSGYPGILNVNHRPVVQGDYGSYNFNRASWKLEWRKC